MPRKLVLTSILTLLSGFLIVVAPSQAVGTDDPLKSQSETDALASASDGPSQGGWSDMDGGVNGRPFISNLSYTNPGSQTVEITPPGGTDDPAFFTTHQLEEGNLTVVVSPLNLCKTGVTARSGFCYETPNRVSINIGFISNNELHRDFYRPSSGQASEITADTVIDMTVNLNSIGSQLRWSQLYGDLSYWKTTNLGQPDASVQLKFKPADHPEIIGDYNTYRGCYTIPQKSCPIQHPTGTYLEASLLLSLEPGYGESLTGAVFSVANGISGEICDGTFQVGDSGSIAPYCRRDASPSNPVMEFQMAGMHYVNIANTELTKASMKAFIPAGALLNIYGITPEDASSTFSVTRTTATGMNETGKNDPPTFTPWTVAENGSAGLLVQVDNVTFSTPKYKIKRKVSILKVAASQTGSTTKLTPTIICSLSTPCAIKVFKLSKRKFIATVGSALVSKNYSSNNPTLSIASSKLKKGDRYLITIRTIAGKLKTSTVGTVN
jgi:hypothetical protein